MAISHCYWHLVGNCCHFATDHLHDYIHFTIYCLQLHFRCSEAQAISAISPKKTLSSPSCFTTQKTNKVVWLSIVVILQLTILMQWKHSCHYVFMFNCHHFATDHLHDYIQFTIYHLEVHFQCCEAWPISAVSPKTCTLNLQLLHNTKRPTKCSGHIKMIDQHGELLHTKDLLPERVTI